MSVLYLVSHSAAAFGLDAVNVHVFVGLDCGIGVAELGFQSVPLGSQGIDGVLEFAFGFAVLLP